MRLVGKVFLSLLVLGGVAVTVVFVVPFVKEEFLKDEQVPANVADEVPRHPRVPVVRDTVELRLGGRLDFDLFEAIEKDNQHYRSVMYRPKHGRLQRVYYNNHLLWDGEASNINCTLVWTHQTNTFNGVSLFLSDGGCENHYYQLKDGVWTRVREYEYTYDLFNANPRDVTLGADWPTQEVDVERNIDRNKFSVEYNYAEEFKTLVVKPKHVRLTSVKFGGHVVWTGLEGECCLLLWAHAHPRFKGVRLHTNKTAENTPGHFYMKWEEGNWTKVNEKEYTQRLFDFFYAKYREEQTARQALRGQTNVELVSGAVSTAVPTVLEGAKGFGKSLLDWVLPPVDSNPEGGAEGDGGAGSTPQTGNSAGQGQSQPGSANGAVSQGATGGEGQVQNGGSTTDVSASGGGSGTHSTTDGQVASHGQDGQQTQNATSSSPTSTEASSAPTSTEGSTTTTDSTSTSGSS